jgi:hypothetical protein
MTRKIAATIPARGTSRYHEAISTTVSFHKLEP